MLTFTAYIVLGHKLTAAKAFTSLSLFTVLRMPLFQLPQVTLTAAELLRLHSGSPRLIEPRTSLHEIGGHPPVRCMPAVRELA